MDDNSGNASERIELLLFGLTLAELREQLTYDSRLERLWRLLETRYADPAFGLKLISRECGMSRNRLNVVLKAVTGLTFHRLLTAYRVYCSIRYLEQHNTSFTEAALEHGFRDSSSYSRTVKRMLKKPPRQLLPRATCYRRTINLPAAVQ